ncbi:MAG: hypothetical protein IID32_00240 [Planctomycetes bacterium]|nr:hypothetical protein [Planctomycetota bacterium]
MAKVESGKVITWNEWFILDGFQKMYSPVHGLWIDENFDKRAHTNQTPHSSEGLKRGTAT